MHQTKSNITLLVVFLTVFTMSSVSAEVPELINYQGRLTDNLGSIVEDGLYQITFTIWDAEFDGNSKWTETHPDVTVSDGLFHVILGSISPLSDSVFNQASRWLGITVDGEDLAPRIRLTSVPYAYNAQSLSMVPTDSPGECDPANKGKLYYDDSKNEPCYCDGTDWVQLDGGGLCGEIPCTDDDEDGYDICDPGNPNDTDGLPADCDDTNEFMNPGLEEVCGDGLDNDCDGDTDYDDIDCALSPGAGDLVITEFMADPNGVPDTQGEWIEIYNPTADHLSLQGVTLEDAATNTHVITTDIVVPMGGYVTLANSAAPGFTPDYVYSGISLNNSGDQITLSIGATVIDQITYGSSTPGTSSELSTNHLDATSNDSVGNWCAAVSYYTATDLGTPGSVNDCAS